MHVTFIYNNIVLLEQQQKLQFCDGVYLVFRRTVEHNTTNSVGQDVSLPITAWLFLPLFTMLDNKEQLKWSNEKCQVVTNAECVEIACM